MSGFLAGKLARSIVPIPHHHLASMYEFISTETQYTSCYLKKEKEIVLNQSPSHVIVAISILLRWGKDPNSVKC